MLKKILKSNRVTHLLCKGLISLKYNGIRITMARIKALFAPRRHLSKLSFALEMPIKVRKQQERKLFTKDITFSIVVPLYNTPENFLNEMIASVKNQTYKKWELCMADGSDLGHSYVQDICEEYTNNDIRIKYRKLKKNLGISENTNACIEMTTGDYIALFDHDDLLHPSALFYYMEKICIGHADILYCDELVFENNLSKIKHIHYKPDFSPDYLRGVNYITHFTVFKKELLQKTGLFRKEFDGSQDHDMILRLAEQTNKIIHIPQVLYFWRSHSNSVAQSISTKKYAVNAGIKAVQSHLERTGYKGIVESVSKANPTFYRTKYTLEQVPLISILIPNNDQKEILKRCIDSIYEKTTYENYEIIIIENKSKAEETFTYYTELEKKENIKVVVWEHEFNYSKINNFGVQYCNGEHIVLLNNDIEVITPNWIEEMLMYSQREEIGAVGAMLYYPNDIIQHAGVIIGIGGVAGHSHKHFIRGHHGYFGRLLLAQNLSAVTAACLMIKKSIFDELKGLDEEFTVAFNDIDFCMRVRKAGYLICWTPFAELYHHESLSRGYEDTPEKIKRFEGETARFRKRWDKELENGDPYYNPNLTLEREDFSFK